MPLKIKPPTFLIPENNFPKVLAPLKRCPIPLINMPRKRFFRMTTVEEFVGTSSAYIVSASRGRGSPYLEL